ncbi:MAG TPA: Wzz/FepE/Etk N-terminal domain-containing protein, partial [Abditibacteriaceae bacterium]
MSDHKHLSELKTLNGNGSYEGADARQPGLASHRNNEDGPGYGRRDLVTVRRADEDVENTIDFQQLLAIIVRRRKIIAATFVTIVFLVAAFTWVAKPIYSATTTILVNTSQGAGAASELPLLSELAGNTKARSQETQIEILKSKPVQQGALSRLAAPVRKELQSFLKIDVTSVRATDVIAITVQSYNAKASAALANEIGSEYIRQSLEQNKDQTRAATRYVEGELQVVRGRLDSARVALKNYKQANGTINLEAQATQEVSQLSQIEADLRQATTERAASAAQVSQLRGMAARMAPTEVVPNQIVRPAAVEAIRSQLSKLELQRVEAREEYTPNSNEVRTIEGQIATLQQQLKKQAQTEVNSWSTTVNPVRSAIIQDLAKVQGQMWALDVRVNSLQSAADKYRARLAQLPEREYRLGQLSTDMASLQQMYQMLNDKYQTLRISQEARLANAKVIDSASTPRFPISPRRARNLVLAVILGLLLAIGLAALVDILDDRVHSDVDAESVTGLPVLTHVPFIKEEDQQCLIGNVGTTSPLLESYRMLRTNIAFSAIDEPIRSVVVSSSQPSEGKSVSSMNLATAMAISGKKVIVVDCDLRKPKVHRLLGLRNQIGFTSVVAGMATIEEALQDTPVPGLRVITSG